MALLPHLDVVDQLVLRHVGHRVQIIVAALLEERPVLGEAQPLEPSLDVRLGHQARCVLHGIKLRLGTTAPAFRVCGSRLGRRAAWLQRAVCRGGGATPHPSSTAEPRRSSGTDSLQQLLLPADGRREQRAAPREGEGRLLRGLGVLRLNATAGSCSRAVGSGRSGLGRHRPRATPQR